MAFKGILIPIGGNEDKGNTNDEIEGLDFIKDGILSRVVLESGGLDANIVVIPTASRIPIEVGENYMKAFDKLGCTDVQVLQITNRDHSEDPSNIKAIQEADCIMFSGGDQSRIVDIIGQSTIHKILMERFKNEPIVIAGTSAGAMAMSSEMISGGSSTEALLKGSVDMREGMDFVPDLIIDSHFIKRGRFGRLAEAVAKFPNLIGVGLAEDTGIIIKDRSNFIVIGSGMVIVFDPSSLSHNNSDILSPNVPMTMVNLTTHVLANSDHFDIKERKVHVLPVEAAFE